MSDLSFYKLKDFPRYEISKCGVVRNIKTGRIMIDKPCPLGYHRLWLVDKEGKRRGVGLHRLLAIQFIKGRTRWKNEVNHKNANKSDNRLRNLEWCTRKYNMKHAAERGLLKGPEKNHLLREAVAGLKSLGWTNYEISDVLDLSQPRIVQLLK